jgi:preprotein translocase subunit YajC
VNDEIRGAGWAVLAQAGNGGGAGGSMWAQLLPFVAIAGLFWLLLIRPESKKRAEHGRMLENLKKNDRVITAGGLFGTVVNVQKGAEDVVLRVDENTNTRVHVLRSSIAKILSGNAGSGDGSGGSGDETKDSE